MKFLQHVLSWCRQNPTDAVGTVSFLLILLGIGMLSVPAALITAGTVIFVPLALGRVLGWDGQPPEKPQ